MTLVTVAHVAVVWRLHAALYWMPALPASEPRAFRFVDLPCLHVMVWPASDGASAGATVRVTTCW